MERIPSYFHTSLTTLLLLLLISPALLLRNSVDPIVTLGTFDSLDNVCFLKKIFKGQPSPVTVAFNHDNIISFARAFTEDGQKKSGHISMNVLEGAIGSSSVILQIAEAAGKSVFKSNAFLEIRCETGSTIEQS